MPSSEALHWYLLRPPDTRLSKIFLKQLPNFFTVVSHCFQQTSWFRKELHWTLEWTYCVLTLYHRIIQMGKQRHAENNRFILLNSSFTVTTAHIPVFKKLMTVRENNFVSRPTRYVGYFRSSSGYGGVPTGLKFVCIVTRGLTSRTDRVTCLLSYWQWDDRSANG
jgi:hypothetical protein